MRPLFWLRGLTVLASFALAAPAFAAPVSTATRYSVVDVGALDPNQPNTTGMAINDSGVVVGSSLVGSARAVI